MVKRLKKALPPRNYVAELVYRGVLDCSDDSEDLIRQFILPHEETAYREQLANIVDGKYFIVSASLSPV